MRKYVETNRYSLTSCSYVDLAATLGYGMRLRDIHTAQEGCVGSKATYVLRDDGKISVLNECNKSFSGKIRSAKGGMEWLKNKCQTQVSFSGLCRDY
jgi:lipocalin